MMTTFNRPIQLERTLDSIRKQRFTGYEIVIVDDGTDLATPDIARFYGTYYRRLNRPSSDLYRNQAIPLNIGIKMCRGDVVIIQNAECRHADEEVIERLTSRVTMNNVVFANVTAMTREGKPELTYCGVDNPRPYFFCGAIHRSWLTSLRGFDQDYLGYGYEDDDMADRLKREGLLFEFSDIKVEHQWHETAGVIDTQGGLEMFKQKCHEPTIRNLTREWGVL